MTEDLLFQWCFVVRITVDNDSSPELLKQIAKLYLTVQGFVFATSCLELYKQEHQKIVDSLFYNIGITRQQEQEQKQEQEINPLQKLTKEHLRRGPKDKEYKISTVIKYNEISKFFNMTLTNAAEKLNISKSLLKRLCRENGITKWPFSKRQKKL